MSPEHSWTCRLLGMLLLVAVLAVASGCSPTIKYLCPPLAPPPSKTIDALEKVGRQDPSSGAWVIQLDKHYQKLDVCKP